MKGDAAVTCGMVFVTFLSACVVESTPETPGNAAIMLLTSIQSGDVPAIEDRLCSAIVDNENIDLSDNTTFGDLGDFYEAFRRNSEERKNASGAGGEFTPAESVTIPVDEAWTEIEFRGEDDSEVWRLQMVREDGRWRACSAVRRQ